MCLSTVGRVLDVDGRGDVAHIDVDGAVRRVGLAPLTLTGAAVGPGDWLVVHSGLAVATLDPIEAAAVAAEHRRLRATPIAPPTMPPNGAGP
jgi:hydrogenase maturation factor